MSNIPLAERMRPVSLDDYIGQEHIVGPNAVLRRAIESAMLSSNDSLGASGSG